MDFAATAAALQDLATRFEKASTNGALVQQLATELRHQADDIAKGVPLEKAMPAMPKPAAEPDETHEGLSRTKR